MNKPLTDQTAFDLALNGIRVQNYEQSLGLPYENGLPPPCRYRGERARKCAVGHLIPDWLYRSSFENRDIHRLIKKVPRVAARFRKVSAILLNEMQVIHDGIDSCSESERRVAYERSMQRLAIRFNLTYTAPTEETKQ